MVRLTIDGKVVEAKKGTSILHAAESVGIKIPTLCYIKDLLPDGSCRMCMVEIENRGRTKMETACTAQVAEGPHTLAYYPHSYRKGSQFGKDNLFFA